MRLNPSLKVVNIDIESIWQTFKIKIDKKSKNIINEWVDDKCTVRWAET